jgi:hypothetical protein
MTEAEYQQKLDELDQLLNGPNAPLDAAKIWSLLSEKARYSDEFYDQQAQEY